MIMWNKIKWISLENKKTKYLKGVDQWHCTLMIYSKNKYCNFEGYSRPRSWGYKGIYIHHLNYILFNYFRGNLGIKSPNNNIKQIWWATRSLNSWALPSAQAASHQLSHPHYNKRLNYYNKRLKKYLIFENFFTY